MLDRDVLLAAYDSQLRVSDDMPGNRTAEWDGPLRRLSGGPNGGFVEYQDLSELDPEALDALIARQVEFFAASGERFEWKTWGHDRPEDLPRRLAAAGFEPEERETVLIGLAERYANRSPALPSDLVLRRTTSSEDYDRIAEMNTVVWGENLGWLADMLRSETQTVYVVEAGDTVVSAAWIRFVPGTDFAGLWGGSTLKEFRGRGIYKALVAVRAADALDEGYRYLQVDASDDSRPILERLGFVAVTTTTPYIWKPR
jgi:hypothetical protein